MLYFDEYIVGQNMGDTKWDKGLHWWKCDDNGEGEWGGWEIRNQSKERCY